MIKFEINNLVDRGYMQECAARAVVEFGLKKHQRLDIELTLTACHSNGCPLDFKALKDAKSADFVHDVAGIDKHLNQETGALENCFRPRYAKRGGDK